MFYGSILNRWVPILTMMGDFSAIQQYPLTFRENKSNKLAVKLFKIPKQARSTTVGHCRLNFELL